MIELPMGLPGFPDHHHFVLLEHKPGSMFRWLQSVEDPGLAFIVVDARSLVPDFPVELVRRSAGFVGIDEHEDLLVLIVCRVPPAPEEPTANFLAPIGIGRTSRKGAQVVMHETGFSTTEKILQS